MLWAVTFLCLLSAANTAIGQREYAVGQRIVGGKVITFDARPFMLSLHSSSGFHCGATILSRTWGITALHCLDASPAKEYYVRAGSGSTLTSGTIHNLTRIVAYNESTFQFLYSKLFYHDIALFEVSPAFSTSKNVRPARLPKRADETPTQLVVSGWGYTGMYNLQPSHDRLMAVRVNYVPYEDCRNLAPWYRKIVNKDYHLCFGTFGRDACYGDSGGPLASKHTIYGIVSFGLDCGKISGIYAKVSFYRHWIHEITNL